MLIFGLRLLLFVAILFSVPVHATSYIFKAPTDPLLARQSSVYYITQDDDGFVWFGSDTDGLIRYDGHQGINWLNVAGNNAANTVQARLNINTFIFTKNNDLWLASWRDGLVYHPRNEAAYRFPVDANNPRSLASQRVQTLFKDSQNRLWIGTIEGLHYIDLNAPLTLNRLAFAEPTHPLFKQRIWGITESPEGLWFATSQGIVLLDLLLQHHEHFMLPTAAAVEVARATEVREIEYINDMLWAGASHGLFKFNVSCRCFNRVNKPKDLLDPRVNVVHPGVGNTLWVGAANGLYQFDIANDRWLNVDDSYNYLPDVDVRSIFLDKDQQLWLGSREQGIFIGHQQYQSFQLLSEQLPANLKHDGNGLTTAIYHDKTSALWVAIQDKLFYRDADKQHWQALEIRQQYGIRKVHRITEDPKGDIWLATDAGLFRVDDLTLTAVTTPFELAQLKVSAVTELAISAQGDFHLGLWQHGLIFWQPALAKAELQLTALSNTSGDQIYHLSQDTGGNFFAVSRYSGLFTKSALTEQWVPFPIAKQTLVDGYNCALPQQQQFLWLCSEFGLWRVDRNNQQLTQYTIQHGLPSMFISAAFFDQQQRFWVLTNQGPARFDTELQRFVSYHIFDGLPDLSMQRNSYSVGPEGETIFGTSSGAVVVQVRPEQESLKAPPLVLAKLIINGIDYTREYQQGSAIIELPYSYRELIVGYALLDYRNPEMNTTRSRLLGLSEHWSPHNTNHEVRYVNLPPGHYTLEVEGQNARGIEAAPLKLRIVVKAPWWSNTWLWLVIIIVLFFAALGFMQLQQKHLNKRNIKLQQLVTARTSELEALTVKLKQRAEQDPLTGLLNRAGFTERFKLLLQSATHQKQAVSLILIDLDHFKQLNDHYGHDAGDKVLQHFAQLLESRVRKDDCVGRWGGEEFIITLANCSTTGAEHFCEALLSNLQQHPCYYHQLTLRYTATFGIVSLPTSIDSLETWVKLADKALYQGKAAGRANVVISEAS